MGSPAALVAADGAPADDEIVRRAQAGDHDAFRMLVERYQGRAYGLALRVLRDEEQAKDAVQDAFLKVYRSLDRFEGRAGFYTWLYRIVMNQCLDRKRRDKSDREVEWNDESAAGVLNASESAASPAGRDADREAPDVAIERSEIRQAVARAIDALPEDARRTIQLREIDGLSYKEIAEAMGIPKGTVMSRLHYARQRLRELLQETGNDPMAAGEAVEGKTGAETNR
ncbi:MAG: sigma-70 family RNA polymerase sigma factor [Acidobacteria bacterium]|nr:sigma-70 family RNA polymerase sigma factor [Myxococcales bacterium]TDI25759.1 MAG: sigma-70 family RNA polymerase sigma factor [Acidobacteriota bacterium]